jgi:hypothetical protein
VQKTEYKPKPNQTIQRIPADRDLPFPILLELLLPKELVSDFQKALSRRMLLLLLHQFGQQRANRG